MIPEPIERKRLLLSGDDVIRSMVRGKLKHLPVEIVEVHSEEEARQALQMQLFDLVILDDMAQALSKSQFGTAKVLYLSSRKRDDDALCGLRIGVDEYLSKPDFRWWNWRCL